MSQKLSLKVKAYFVCNTSSMIEQQVDNQNNEFLPEAMDYIEVVLDIFGKNERKEDIGKPKN